MQGGKVRPIYRGDIDDFMDYEIGNAFDAVGLWWGGLLLKRLADEVNPLSEEARQEIEQNLGGFATAISAITARLYALNGQAAIIRGEEVDPRLSEAFMASGMSSSRVHDLLPYGSASLITAGGVAEVQEGHSARQQKIWPPDKP